MIIMLKQVDASLKELGGSGSGSPTGGASPRHQDGDPDGSWGGFESEADGDAAEEEVTGEMAGRSTEEVARLVELLQEQVEVLVQQKTNTSTLDGLVALFGTNPDAVADWVADLSISIIIVSISCGELVIERPLSAFECCKVVSRLIPQLRLTLPVQTRSEL